MGDIAGKNDVFGVFGGSFFEGVDVGVGIDMALPFAAGDKELGVIILVV